MQQQPKQGNLVLFTQFVTNDHLSVSVCLWAPNIVETSQVNPHIWVIWITWPTVKCEIPEFRLDFWIIMKCRVGSHDKYLE